MTEWCSTNIYNCYSEEEVQRRVIHIDIYTYQTGWLEMSNIDFPQRRSKTILSTIHRAVYLAN